MAFGAAGKPEYAETFGKIVAIEARAIGVHWNFFPVADVKLRPGGMRDGDEDLIESWRRTIASSTLSLPRSSLSWHGGVRRKKRDSIRTGPPSPARRAAEPVAGCGLGYDIVPCSLSEFRKDRDAPGSLVHNAVTEGRAIYRERRWRKAEPGR